MSIHGSARAWLVFVDNTSGTEVATGCARRFVAGRGGMGMRDVFGWSGRAALSARSPYRRGGEMRKMKNFFFSRCLISPEAAFWRKKVWGCQALVNTPSAKMLGVVNDRGELNPVPPSGGTGEQQTNSRMPHRNG